MVCKKGLLAAAVGGDLSSGAFGVGGGAPVSALPTAALARSTLAKYSPGGGRRLPVSRCIHVLPCGVTVYPAFSKMWVGGYFIGSLDVSRYVLGWRTRTGGGGGGGSLYRVGGSMSSSSSSRSPSGDSPGPGRDKVSSSYSRSSLAYGSSCADDLGAIQISQVYVHQCTHIFPKRCLH